MQMAKRLWIVGVQIQTSVRYTKKVPGNISMDLVQKVRTMVKENDLWIFVEFLMNTQR